MSGVGRETIARADNLLAEGREYAGAIEALARVLDVPAAQVDDVLDQAEATP